MKNSIYWVELANFWVLSGATVNPHIEYFLIFPRAETYSFKSAELPWENFLNCFMKYSIEMTWSVIDDVLEYTLHISTTFCNQKWHFTCIFWTSFIKSDPLNKLLKRIFHGGSRFENWSISAQIRLQIARELVRLITLIGLTNFWCILYPRGLRKYLSLVIINLL